MLVVGLQYFCCSESAGQNLLVNRPCCHPEHFVPLYHTVMFCTLLLILFVISNFVIFSLRDTTLVNLNLNLNLTYLRPFLSTSLRIGPFCFQVGGRKRRAEVVLVFLCFLCVVVYSVTVTWLLLLC